MPLWSFIVLKIFAANVFFASLLFVSVIEAKSNFFENPSAFTATHEVVLSGKLVSGKGKKLIHLLQQADHKTHIIIYIKSTGGLASEAERIVEAMQHSKAFITTEIIYFAGSGAALIAIVADRILVSKPAEIIFHIPQRSFYLYRKSFHEKSRSGKKRVIQHANVIKRYAPKLFTSENWRYFYAGGDVYMTGRLFVRRLKKASFIEKNQRLSEKQRKLYKLRKLDGIKINY